VGEFAIVLTLLVDVATGGKRPARAGDDDAADAVIGVHRLHRIAEFRRELAVHRVELLRPVQRQDADAIFLFHKDVFVLTHFAVLLPLVIPARTRRSRAIAWSLALDSRLRR